MSYFHNPATLGMQHVSALLLSTWVRLCNCRAANSGPLDIKWHDSAVLQVLGCYSYLPEFGRAVSVIEVSGVPQNWHTNSTLVWALIVRTQPQAIPTSTWKGSSKLLRKIKIKMYVETVVPTVSFELSDMQQLPPDKTMCNKCCGIQSTTEPSALWYQCVIAPRCWRVWGIPGVTISRRSKSTNLRKAKISLLRKHYLPEWTVSIVCCYSDVHRGSAHYQEIPSPSIQERKNSLKRSFQREKTKTRVLVVLLSWGK